MGVLALPAAEAGSPTGECHNRRISVDGQLRRLRLLRGTVTHVAGDSLSIERPDDEKLPKVLVSRLTHASAKGDLPDTTEVEAPVLERDQTLSSGEVIREQGMVSVGERHPDTIAYQVRLIFDGGWEGKVWTWSPNKILPVTDKTLKS